MNPAPPVIRIRFVRMVFLQIRISTARIAACGRHLKAHRLAGRGAGRQPSLTLRR
jgi:hypothetical protein